MNINPDRSSLVVIDIQEKLTSVMTMNVFLKIKKNTQILLQAANSLKIPVGITLQYPKGLGQLDNDLQTSLPETTTIFEKTTFSCVGNSDFNNYIENIQRDQILLAGMETHICVLQTAMDLRKKGFQVFMIEDATCSRTIVNHTNGITRAVKADIMPVVTESVLFEWIKDAKHPEFKSLSKLIR